MGDVDFDECLIPSVEGDLTITVTGVADITPPEAELTIAGNPFRQFLNTVTFGLFFKSTQTVTVTVSDLGSGVDTAAWMLSDTVFASQDAITGSWTDLSLTDGSGRRVDYCADCGIFNDLAAGRHLTLSDSARDDMNARLTQYGPLWDMG